MRFTLAVVLWKIRKKRLRESAMDANGPFLVGEAQTPMPINELISSDEMEAAVLQST